MENHSAAARTGFVRRVSLPGAGWRGINKANSSDMVAIPAAAINTADGDVSHRYPKSAGKKTAAM